MKSINLLRANTGPQGVFTEVSDNLQEVTQLNKVSVSASPSACDPYRPRILAQRATRHARRFAH